MASVERPTHFKPHTMTTTLLIAALLSMDVAMMTGCEDQGKPADKPATPTPASPTPATPANPSAAPTATTPPAPATPTAAPPKLLPEFEYKTTDVTIGKTKFTLQIASEDKTRMRGLGGRTEIPENGGMIFVFPPRMVGVQGFIMRDCYVDIDIIYTDGVGRVLSFHEMTKQAPRGLDGKYEGEVGDYDINSITDATRRQANINYHSRLKQYSSKYPATFAIELKAGSIKKLGVREGDLVTMDHAGLKKMAK